MKRILLILICLTLGYSKTILIPEDYQTIQEGIDWAGEIDCKNIRQIIQNGYLIPSECDIN